MADRLTINWKETLDSMEASLASTLSTADALLGQSPEAAPAALAATREQELAATAERLLGLQKRMEASETLLHKIDAALAESEEMMHRTQRTAAGVKRKLTAWNGRALS